MSDRTLLMREGGYGNGNDNLSFSDIGGSVGHYGGRKVKNYSIDGSAAAAAAGEDDRKDAKLQYDESNRSTFQQVYVVVAVFGLIANLILIILLVRKLMTKKRRIASSCLIALSTADSTTLLFFLILPLFTITQDTAAAHPIIADYLMCKVPVFVIHITSSFSLWCLVVLAFISYAAAYHPVGYRASFLLRTPTFLLFLVLVACSISQLWILFSIHYDQATQQCQQVEWYTRKMISGILIVDVVVHYFIPILILLLLSCQVSRIVRLQTLFVCSKHFAKTTNSTTNYSANNLTERYYYHDNNSQYNHNQQPYCRMSIPAAHRSSLPPPPALSNKPAPNKPTFLLENDSRNQQISTSQGPSETDDHASTTAHLHVENGLSRRIERSNTLPSSVIEQVVSMPKDRGVRRRQLRIELYRQYFYLTLINVTFNLPFQLVRFLNCLEISFESTYVGHILFPYIYLLYYAQYCFNAILAARIMLGGPGFFRNLSFLRSTKDDANTSGHGESSWFSKSLV